MYLSCGHYRGRIQTKTARIFESLADAWTWAMQQDKGWASRPLARIWLVSSSGEPILLKPLDIQTSLGLPLKVKDWA